MALWLALAVYVVAVVGGLLYVVLRGLALWRKAKRTGGVLGAEAERISLVAAQIEVHMDRLNVSAANLEQATGRLARSRARLDVQLQAVREARETMRRLLWFLPGA